MSIVGCRQEIAKYWRAALPGATVLEHGGSFDLEEIKRVATKVPALIVTCLGVPELEVHGGAISACGVTFVMFAVAANTSKATRDVLALAMVEAILVDLPTRRWANTANNVPTNITASNLYSGNLDRQGVSLWAVRWQQEVDLEPNIWSDLDSLTLVNSKIDLAPLDVPTITNAEDNIVLVGA